MRSDGAIPSAGHDRLCLIGGGADNCSLELPAARGCLAPGSVAPAAAGTARRRPHVVALIGRILFSLLFFSLYLPFSRAAVERYPDPDEVESVGPGWEYYLDNLVASREGVKKKDKQVVTEKKMTVTLVMDDGTTATTTTTAKQEMTVDEMDEMPDIDFFREAGILEN